VTARAHHCHNLHLPRVVVDDESVPVRGRTPSYPSWREEFMAAYGERR
jgi:hypothetical protein